MSIMAKQKGVGTSTKKEFGGEEETNRDLTEKGRSNQSHYGSQEKNWKMSKRSQRR
jgi:hypothetical protein